MFYHCNPGFIANQSKLAGDSPSVELPAANIPGYTPVKVIRATRVGLPIHLPDTFLTSIHHDDVNLL